jgi:hypothetical protein
MVLIIFFFSISIIVVAIFQHHQCMCMAFTFHTSYVILELVPSTVIFWTDFNCWRKSYSSKATLLPDWSHRYKNSTVVITIWLTVTKYLYLKWQWIVYFLRRCFLPSISAKTFTGRDEHLSCPIMCLHVLSSVLWCRLPKRCSVRLYLQLFVGAHVLFTLFVIVFA